MTTRPLFHVSSFSTPLGAFSVALDSSGAVAAAVFGGEGSLRRRLPRGTFVRDPRRTAALRGQIEAWFRGAAREFSVELAPAGTPFQHRVWEALRQIPFGETRTYGDVARIIGSAPRAVGRANAANPVCLIVPCHRVIGADGSLTGYAFGEETKRRLIEFERSEVSAPLAGAPRR